MRFFLTTHLTLALALLLIGPVCATQESPDTSSRSEINLGDYEIVIGDMGYRYEDWRDSPNRTRVQVSESDLTREYFFDSLPAAMFVLRQMYGDPRFVQMEVLDYAGQELIDGTQAYYVWDDAYQSQGGLPLVLAFSNLLDAQDAAHNRNSQVMDFDNALQALNSWEDEARDRIYWRGWDQDYWNTDRWNSAWESRWLGWAWDQERGWSKVDAKSDKDEQEGNRKHVKRDRSRDNRKEEQKDKGDSGKGGGKGHRK